MKETTRFQKHFSGRRLPACLATIALLILVPALGQGKAAQKAQIKKLQQMAPGRGYLEAHSKVQNPPQLLGGPLHISVSQEVGGVHVALPDHRRLDPNVFGTPKMPRAFAGTPGINGVPPMARGVKDGRYTEMKALTPFGNKSLVMRDGKLSIKAVDATAVDGATTKDSVQMSASWEDKAGNHYEVKCCKMMAAHGVEYPTFGGVVTNHLLHGFTRLGTGLMPTEFAYFAFWGIGEVLENGKVVDSPRLIHGMLTEYVRGPGYTLDEDAQVDATHRHFHLMVPPFMPNAAHDAFMPKPVHTGFKLPNGMELPFWHVMFNNLKIGATHE